MTIIIEHPNKADLRALTQFAKDRGLEYSVVTEREYEKRVDRNLGRLMEEAKRDDLVSRDEVFAILNK